MLAKNPINIFQYDLNPVRLAHLSFLDSINGEDMKIVKVTGKIVILEILSG